MELLYHVLFYMSTLFYNFFRIDFDLIISNYKNSLSHFSVKKMTAPSKMGRKHELNYISNGVGWWLAAAVEINENKTAIGCYQINDYYENKAFL